MALYTEEAATEEECISKISRAHKIERRDFNDKIKIVRVRRVTRASFLGILKRNLVEITYLLAQPLDLAPPAKKTEEPSPAKSYAAAQGISAPTPSGARAAPLSRPLPQGKSFDDNRQKLLQSVLEANPNIMQKVLSTNHSAQPKPASGGRSAKKSSSQLDLITEDDFAFEEEQEEEVRDYRETAAAPPQESAEVKREGEGDKASSEEMQALIREVREIGRRIDMEVELGKVSGEEHRNIAKIMDILELNDFAPSFMNTVRERIRADFTIEALSDFEYLQRKVLSWAGAAIKIAEERSVTRPHLITLVGPTGAGKTTTVAKLAAAYIRAYKKATRPLNVRVITIDNYRIGAKQHLEKYGEIMGVTVSSAEMPQDLHKLISLYQDADIILIDTTGRSPKDHMEIANMSAFFEGLQDSGETLLAVSACTKTSDLRDIIRQYGVFPLDGLVITKFDETSRVGNIISVLAEESLPVSYITTGQRVPKDFEAASVMKFLLALEGFSVNILGMREEFPDPEKRFEWS